jgi:hypothetical protein
MIRTRNPRIDVAELERRMDEELARDPGARGDERLTRLAATVHARTIEAQLDRAEERSAPRTEWPEDLRLPFVGSSQAVRRFVLRVLSMMFRDQHHVNAALIHSQRETLALVQTLLDRIEVLETRVDADRAAARALRIAQRRGEDA